MESPKISVIIPAYNASSTIVRCLDSIYGLSLDESEYEVVVVDDCSQDNTATIVEECSQRHVNLILLRQPENHNLGAARNKGVAAAKGQYVVFVDSDDESAEGMNAAVKLAEENDLDMVAMRYVKVGKDGNIEKELRLPYDKRKIFTGVEMQTEFPYWSVSVWSYVYKRSFLEQVNYPFVEDMFFEDSDFTNVHLFHAGRMSYCDECGYVVHYNPVSITHTLTYKHLSDYALMGTRMLHFFESLEDKTSKYAQGILEGGSYNIMKAFSRLYRLRSLKEGRAFYDRFDAHYDRRMLLGYRHPANCWTPWTRFCLKHRSMALLCVGFAMPFYRILK